MLNNRKQAIRLVEAQILATLVLVFIVLWINRIAAYSALTGGLICVLGNGYLAYKLFQKAGAQATGEIATLFYRGEFGKLAIIAFLFGIVFKWVHPINPLMLFLGYLVAQGVFWLSPLILDL